MPVPRIPPAQESLCCHLELLRAVHSCTTRSTHPKRDSRRPTHRQEWPRDWVQQWQVDMCRVRGRLCPSLPFPSLPRPTLCPLLHPHRSLRPQDKARNRQTPAHLRIARASGKKSLIWLCSKKTAKPETGHQEGFPCRISKEVQFHERGGGGGGLIFSISFLSLSFNQLDTSLSFIFFVVLD